MKCPFCDGIADLKIEPIKITFRKEDFNIIKQFYKCNKCKEQFTTDDLDEVNINQVYNQYREKYQIPFPQQLIKIRGRYGLSASKMAEVLGFGVNVYRNYESGEIPNVSNGTLLNLIRMPEEFKKVILNKKKVFTEKQFNKLVDKLDKLIEKERSKNYLDKFLLDENSIPNEFSGFSSSSIEKYANMILFFLENNNNLFKVKLNKLLFYTDFYHFKKTGYSISGYKYQAIQNGPVPYRYDLIYDYLWQNEFIQYELVEINDNLVEQPVPLKKFNEDCFEKSELDALKTIHETFKKLTRKELVDLSHQEKAWEEQIKHKGVISYLKYAFNLLL
ncbi:MAG: type II toxin-antitoxin system antitoxin SocA domain-containing protein [Bacteroidota bacterium]